MITISTIGRPSLQLAVYSIIYARARGQAFEAHILENRDEEEEQPQE
jgi:hypothetical protein